MRIALTWLAPPALLLLASAASAQTVVVVGNKVTGRIVSRTDKPDLAQSVSAEARNIRPDGWTVLVSSSQPGWGAAMCVREGAEIQFAAVHGFASAREAVRAAQDKIKPIAARARDTFFICGPTWKTGGAVSAPSARGTLLDSARRALTDPDMAEKCRTIWAPRIFADTARARIRMPYESARDGRLPGGEEEMRWSTMLGRQVPADMPLGCDSYLNQNTAVGVRG